MKNLKVTKKLMLVLTLGIIFINLVGAAQLTEIQGFPEGIDIILNQQNNLIINSDYHLRVHTYNHSTGAKIDNTSTYCALHFNKPNGAEGLFNNMTYNLSTQEFYLYIDNENFTTNGLYPWIIECQFDNGGKKFGGFLEGLLEINPSGLEFTSARSILYIGLFAVLIFTFFITFFGIGLLPSSNTSDEEGNLLSISYLKYFRTVLWFVEWMILLAIFFVSSNLAFAFLGEEMFAQLFLMMFKVCFGLTPIIVIVWIMWIIAQIIQDKRIRNLWERGMMGEDI